ncbi:GAF domain-containing protein [Mycobacterium sp. CBMA361]|nr:GAF domain-containing protein [Mycolicibacterium sp. CBMA 361]
MAPRSRNHWWSGEVELTGQLAVLHERVNAAVGRQVVLPAAEWALPSQSAEAASVLTHACIEHLRQTTVGDRETAQHLCDLILQLQQLSMDFYLQQTATRGRRLADCTTGLSRLRGVSSSNALIESACEELVQRCGFHRAVISKLESRSWKPLVLHNREDNAATHSWFNEWVNKTVPLSQTAPEAEMVSRRRPSLVYDTDNAPVYRPLIVQAGQSRSYVVAPLVHGDDVIGFLHTDHHPLSRRVDEMDRDVLWAFTDGFTHIYERALLIEQLRAHRDSVRDLFFGAVERIDELLDSGLEISRVKDDTTPRSGPAPMDGAATRLGELTEREVEVFELMVTGASNQEIADQLVITEGTVKSHVKHILRKYGAANRAQAIAWALTES